MNCLRYLTSMLVAVVFAQFLLGTALSSDAPGGHDTPTAIPLHTEAESPEPIELTPAEKIEQIKAKREESTKELEQSQKALQNATTHEREAPVLQIAVDLLQRTDLVYGQQLAALEHSIEFERLNADLSASLSALRTSGPTEERPFSFFLLDGLRDELARDKAKSENVAEAVKSAEDNLEQAKEDFDAKEQVRRLAKERVDTNEDQEKIGELDSELRDAMLRSKFAETQVALRQLELANQKAAAELHETTIMYLEEKIRVVEPEAQFTPPDLQNQLEEIAKKEEKINEELKYAQQNLAWREHKLIEARQRLDESLAENPALMEEIESWRLAREARQVEVSLLTKQLVRLSEMKQLWNHRFRYANNDYNRNDLTQWKNAGNSALEQLARDERLQTARLTDLRRDLLSIENKIDAQDSPGKKYLEWVQAQRKYLNQLIVIYENDLASVNTRRRLEEKVIAELQATTGDISISEWSATAWDAAKRAWVIEITHIDDRPITVGKIILSILFFVLGVTISRYFSAMLGRRILPGVGLSHSASMAFQTVIFYFLLFGFTLVILNILNVPLTAFTVLGGALAIGVGFGAQNIINNFISGWILIAGQGVRIDDLIEVEHEHGHVKSIGARSTLIRRDDGVDMLVPNSHLLEHTVVNWTLTDNIIRTKVRVGVIYGTPAEKVAALIQTVADEDPDILQDPDPFIIFQDFGDNSLVFDLYFWISAHSEMDVWKAQSKIRYRIDKSFHEAGIVIAFPQRDVHLDTNQPLEIRMISNGASSKAADN